MAILTTRYSLRRGPANAFLHLIRSFTEVGQSQVCFSLLNPLGVVHLLTQLLHEDVQFGSGTIWRERFQPG